MEQTANSIDPGALLRDQDFSRWLGSSLFARPGAADHGEAARQIEQHCPRCGADVLMLAEGGNRGREPAHIGVRLHRQCENHATQHLLHRLYRFLRIHRSSPDSGDPS